MFFSSAFLGLQAFKIKMVEPLPFLTKSQRTEILTEAGYNLFLIKAEHVTFDFLTIYIYLLKSKISN